VKRWAWNQRPRWLAKPECRSWDGKLEKYFDRQRVGNATPGKFRTRWWQARRARSDAPYRAGRAAGPFDFIAHFGILAKHEPERFSIKQIYNHKWTQISTDEEMSERRCHPVFCRPLNGALDEQLESHVFYLCLSICDCPSELPKHYGFGLRILSVFICVHPWLKFFFPNRYG
jgi:hypothetical protein